MDFGLRLKTLRTEKNLTQAQVAKRVNLTASTISAYENNTKSPTIDTLAGLAMLFGVTADYLLGLEKRRMVFIDDLTDRQVESLNLLLMEFRNPSK